MGKWEADHPLARRYIGKDFIRQQELDEFDRQVTPLEYDACL